MHLTESDIADTLNAIQDFFHLQVLYSYPFAPAVKSLLLSTPVCLLLKQTLAAAIDRRVRLECKRCSRQHRWASPRRNRLSKYHSSKIPIEGRTIFSVDRTKLKLYILEYSITERMIMVTEKIGKDIGYVKNLVDKSEQLLTPPSVFVVWAVIVAVGFTLVDFAPRYVGFFWMIASPLGGLLSGFLGRKTGRSSGQIDNGTGRKHAVYWSGMLAITMLAVLLGVKGFVHGAVTSQIILLIVAMGWWGAGMLFDRYFLYLAGIMMAGFVATLFFSRYVWTAMGILLAITLTAVAVYKGKQNASRTQ
jgi:hypothetical protein